MTTTQTSAEGRTQLSSQEVSQSLRLFEISPDKLISVATLRTLLPDVETALFFAKAYDLRFDKVSELVRLLFRTDVIQALLGEGQEHSSELQDYVIGIVPDHIQAQHGQGSYSDEHQPPDTELLKQLFEQAVVEVAQSIKDVATKLSGVLDSFPSKYGSMTFQHLHKLNVQRNTIGTYSAQIQHERVEPRLVVLDVSGSMTESTIERIVQEVVGLAYAVDASLAIVSNNAFLWEAGTFDVDTVLRHAEYGGTHYEQLLPIFHRDWESVITIADYDSAWTAKDFLRLKARGRVGKVYDISLVNKPTFLAECVGQIAGEVQPLLIGNSQYVLSY